MLIYAPTNEQEVVCLFSLISEKLGYRIERIQTDFPDCIAIDKDNQRLRIEFEYLTKNFIDHKHPIEECDLVIAWLDNYNLKERIRVIELRDFFPELEENPNISVSDAKVNKTLEGLSLIWSDKADKHNLENLFIKYHIKEMKTEPVRFITRLIVNGGEPFIDDEKLKLGNIIDHSKLIYGVSNNIKESEQAREILKELKIDSIYY